MDLLLTTQPNTLNSASHYYILGTKSEINFVRGAKHNTLPPAQKKMHAHGYIAIVACPDLPYFFTLSHKRHDFGKILLKDKWVLNFFTNILWNIYYTQKNSRRYYHIFSRFSCKRPLFLSDFKETWIVSKDSGEIIKFDEYPSNGSRVTAYGQTYKQIWET